jgi:hypothetical protein
LSRQRLVSVFPTMVCCSSLIDRLIRSSQFHITAYVSLLLSSPHCLHHQFTCHPQCYTTPRALSHTGPRCTRGRHLRSICSGFRPPINRSISIIQLLYYETMPCFTRQLRRLHELTLAILHESEAEPTPHTWTHGIGICQE